MLKILGVCVVAIALVSCAGHRAPSSSLNQPPSIRLNHHTVSRGDTLYSIAWRYGQDFRKLAAINGIKPPYNIYPGQRLHLNGKVPRQVASSSPVARKKTVAKPAPTQKAIPAKNTKSLTKSSTRQKPQSKRTGTIHWRWPVRGQVISKFRSGDPLRKGVDIAGEKGESVSAAADGTVIYAGSALRGYGKLLIVKHSDVYLSAYAHNHRLLVKEGSKVKAGQRIAELGSSGTNRDKLHFEIRKNGQPVDPLAYLP
ncbi:peptidoglycan DD-metalloendopeptidase family protein [Microbulbifer variabilis]|uniref:peptidoglycan DD-metalloendopeptidase family protein n=1 Tax=Microbulbifer variabilis TaxID=266805 RepID=UPI003F49E8D8